MRTRYRVGSCGGIFNRKQVLILQVYKHFPDGENDYHGMPTYLAHDKWVDAKPEDVLEVQLSVGLDGA